MTTTTTSIHLGPLYASITLAAQLIDTTGVPVGDPITTGFTEIGSNGDYLWTADTSAVAQGGVKVYEDGAPETVLAVGALPTASTQLAAILDDTGTTLPATLATINANVLTRTSLGSGAIAFVYTLTSSVDGSPIADADVWATSDEAGSILLANGRTNASGQVTFYLDAGTVYIWRQKIGWNYSNPDTETVS